jgi:DNA-binding CsgD family transcriptional regulator
VFEEPQLNAAEQRLMRDIGEALHSSLELRVVFDRAVPLLQQLIGCDHVALAVSKPGGLYDYEWLYTSLPAEFLGNYAAFADQDFVRHAVAARPNRVLRDQQMLTRRELERHIVYNSARETGVGLEHVMAVMLSREREWSSGLSLYRSRHVPFCEREAAMLQMVVPQIKNAVRNAREHASLKRAAWLETVVDQVGAAVVWVDASGAELARVGAVEDLLDQFFPDRGRRRDPLPQPLVHYLLSFVGSAVPNKVPQPFVVETALCRLEVAFLALPQRCAWALVFRTRGLTPDLQAKLSPRLLEVAASLVRGLSNQEIADRDGRSLATVRQQASDVYGRLGVQGRKGLIRLVWGDEQ